MIKQSLGSYRTVITTHQDGSAWWKSYATEAAKGYSSPDGVRSSYNSAPLDSQSPDATVASRVDLEAIFAGMDGKGELAGNGSGVVSSDTGPPGSWVADFMRRETGL